MSFDRRLLRGEGEEVDIQEEETSTDVYFSSFNNFSLLPAHDYFLHLLTF